ncbi:hypothetical protein N7481_007010 [Penicillium waksmanii]|uniref:uncharacterized protein n=1 Tax=Penicillium waksmanii TaxID=69791 RepID=UPI00254785C6|nr:uncharacterized protein N7481_007010 [Penicillium waksmanii]KAJ5979712.1 hypothetical protein N7481_007010 [Penicillium waksmanii]
MPPPANPANDEAHQALLNERDIGILPKPFRNPHWKPSQRRNKNLKQIISENSRKEASVLATQANSGATTPFTAATDGSQTPAEAAPVGNKPPNLAQASQNLSTMVLEKNARAYATGPTVTYTNIESAPSLSAAHQRHYCDLTGLPGPYTDPKTRLRYHDKELFRVIRSLAQGVPESYLEARGGSYGIEIDGARRAAERSNGNPLLLALSTQVHMIIWKYSTV